MPSDLRPPASAWVRRFAPLVRSRGPVLDIACGSGRHLRLFREGGHPVTGIDLDLRGVADLRGQPGAELIQADLENGNPWPLPGGKRFAGIVVTNYLHRPLFGAILDSLEPGGLLIYETFARGNERFGRPSAPAFLLRAGELLEIVRDRLHVVAFEQGEVASPRAAVIQRIAAIADPLPIPELGGDPEPRPLPLPIRTQSPGD